jgi:hypothetical protein
MSALPIAAPLDIKAASSANSIAVGYVKNSDDSFGSRTLPLESG